ncbi:MAG: hypothetical protein M3410_00890 [Acidobacteriota bacterium]|nr:hypothetical protein [Acidobacteriota bacterium]
MFFLILKGFKLIAVGELCDSQARTVKDFSEPGGVKHAQNVTLSGSADLLVGYRGRHATLAHGY